MCNDFVGLCIKISQFTLSLTLVTSPYEKITNQPCIDFKNIYPNNIIFHTV